MNANTTALATVCNTLASAEMRGKIHQAMLAGVDEDRFIRTALTAIQTSPQLAEADRNSLYNAVLKSAQDGLLPDGKEGALVVFNTKVKDSRGEHWEKRVQWMPMFYGLRKRLAKSGVLLDANVVHANDEFTYELGDDPKIVHKPPALGKERGNMIGAYAIARLKDGTVMREIMDGAQIEAVRGQSRAKDSLMWTTFKSEAWRKTVGRRLTKAIPTLDDSVQEMLKRDDETFQFEENVTAEEQPATPAEPKRRSRTLEAVVEDGPPPADSPTLSDDVTF